MADRNDKRRRKEALDRWKADQRAAARAKLPLPDDQLKSMFDRLDADLPKHGCDHTLRLTRAWLESQALPVEAVVAGCTTTAVIATAKRSRIPSSRGKTRFMMSTGEVLVSTSLPRERRSESTHSAAYSGGSSESVLHIRRQSPE